MKVQRMYEAKMVLVEYVSSSSSWIFRGQKNTHFATVDKNLATFWLITSNVAFGCCCMLLLLLKYWHEWKRLTGLYSLKLRDLCWMHSNDSHQCPILAADLFWDRKWIAYLYPSLTSWPCLDGFFIFCPIIKNNKVSCQYGTLMWIIAVAEWNTSKFAKKNLNWNTKHI